MPRPVTDAEVSRAAKTAGIPPNVLRAMLFKGERSGANSTSPKGAYGQAQLMPGTAKGLEQRYGINTRTAYGNVLGGAYYLAEQKKRFGSWRLAFAAYNAGPGAVAEYGGVPPYKETQAYVDRTMTGLLANAKVPNKQTGALGGGVALPSSQVGEAAAPDPLVASTAEGLRDLIEGDYNPSRALAGLERLQQVQAEQPEAPTPSPSATPLPHPGTRERAGITFSGQKLTHDTDGLPGFPAVDLFGDPGTPFTAPEDGQVIRRSGRGGTKGQTYGWSVYFKGKSGRVYYIQHLNKDRAKIGRYKQGDRLGTISPWEGGSPHAHVGVKGGKQ